MHQNRSNQIREIIRRQRRSGEARESLEHRLAESIPRLHEAIHLPRGKAQEAMLDFALRYLDHVPNFVDALRGLSAEAGIGGYAGTLLHAAEDFFLEPPDLIPSGQGLFGLLCQAYLAHRLIEELNDRVVARCGLPLVPMDMTRANLVIHQVIGEPFANDLDFLVHYATEVRMDKEVLMDNPTFRRFVDQHRANGWQAELDRWPCLAEDLSINLLFRSQADSEAFH